jgi:DNA-binding transcriptional LysR family regulator
VVLLASPGYLRHAGVPATVEDLAGHRCAAVRFASGAASTWRFGRGRKAQEFAPPAQVLTSDPESVLELALADGGIVQAALHHALPYLRSGRLKLLLPGLHDPGPREVVLHYPHRLYLAPRVRVVVDALLAQCAQAGDLHLGVDALVAALPQCLASSVSLPAGAGTPASAAARPRGPARSRPR